MRIALGEDTTGPLAGIRVLDLSTIVSGPLCAQILGDLGAEVTKIEARAGDTSRYLGGERRADMTGFFTQFNRNKRSAVLDLKSELGVKALKALAASADVLVENFRPDVMERLGLPAKDLLAANPRLIYVAISGFGPEGPYREQPAYDMVIQALSGFAKLLGSEQEPKLISNVIADKTSGLTAAWAILAALFARERSGKGQKIDVPMLDAFAGFVLPDTFGPRVFGELPGDPALGDALYRAWPTADGHVAVIIIEDHQYQALCRVLEREDLLEEERFATLGGRLTNAAELFATMEEELRKHATAELVRRAHEYGAPIAAVNGMDEFLADPQVLANETVFESEHPEAGTLKMFRSAPRFSETPSDLRLHPPRLGEHTEEVLREAGLSEAEIDAALGRG
jgi:crotonobetainyl-CoA:carnitine CoA-transferase CaiB-like acyl-CoA transferase